MFIKNGLSSSSQTFLSFLITDDVKHGRLEHLFDLKSEFIEALDEDPDASGYSRAKRINENSVLSINNFKQTVVFNSSKINSKLMIAQILVHELIHSRLSVSRVLNRNPISNIYPSNGINAAFFSEDGKRMNFAEHNFMVNFFPIMAKILKEYDIRENNGVQRFNDQFYKDICWTGVSQYIPNWSDQFSTNDYNRIAGNINLFINLVD